jgi:hypothetical protein
MIRDQHRLLIAVAGGLRLNRDGKHANGLMSK